MVLNRDINIGTNNTKLSNSLKEAGKNTEFLPLYLNFNFMAYEERKRGTNGLIANFVMK